MKIIRKKEVSSDELNYEKCLRNDYIVYQKYNISIFVKYWR